MWRSSSPQREREQGNRIYFPPAFFGYFPIPLLSFALSLSKGRPFMVRPEPVEGSLSKGHHERTWFNWLIIERS